MPPSVDAVIPRPTTEPWQDQPLSALIRHILDTHHVFTRTELTRLDDLSRQARSQDADRFPQLARVHAVLAALADDLAPHLRKEEVILFPYIEELEAAGEDSAPAAPFGSVENPVRMMNMEHEQVVELLERMRELTESYSPPEGAGVTMHALYSGLAALDRDLRQHIQVESEILFPRALELERASER